MRDQHARDESGGRVAPDERKRDGDAQGKDGEAMEFANNTSEKARSEHDEWCTRHASTDHACRSANLVAR
jgi:hypothetical protein